jgi:hypothetical protein
MSLSSNSIHWAIKFVQNHADGDLFPKILEFDVKTAAPLLKKQYHDHLKNLLLLFNIQGYS